MNQVELRQMTTKRIHDAKVLLKGGRWEFAYYVSGYAVECALKSCLLSRMVRTAWVFEDRWKAQDCLTHDFSELIRLAGMTDDLNLRLQESAAVCDDFVNHWATANQWKVTTRYESKTETEASELFTAITHKPDGVLRWLKNY